MDRHLINIKDTLFQGLAKLNVLSGSTLTLFVVDDELRLVGSLTDGDIRRSLLSGKALDSPVGESMYRKCRSITMDDCDVADIKELRKLGIRLLPKLDSDGRIIGYMDLTKQLNLLPLTAILMAGGKGERLRPLTLETPKPLLKVGGKSIIDHNVDAMRRSGIQKIYVTVKYLAEKVRKHFEGQQDITCVEEDQPLGTIGAASLVPLTDEGNTLVMNSDLLTTVSFEDMYLHHRSHKADITIATIPYQVSVPYAILDFDDGGGVTGLMEKPSYSYLANAGIYIIKNKLLKELSPNVRTDATDLIEQAIAQGCNVTNFPINGYWLDIGNPADFKQANELMKTIDGFK
ncbi:MAG: NTP transferase domain-containing protein [Bacteroidales bacterium]|nr:NTP transferase domain-containing protein [Bacteroidales bacterium]